MAPKVLLVTTVNWPSTARLAGAFAGAGMAVDAACPNGHVMCGSRFVAERYRYTAWEPLTSLARAIEKSRPDLLVPCDDRAVSQLLRLGGQFDVVARSLGAPENYSTLLARGPFIAAARMLGLQAPETIVVPGEQFLDIALARVGLPCVMKADGSWGGDGVVIVHDRSEAYEHFCRLSEPPSRLRSLARAMKRRDAHFLREMMRPRPMAVCVQRFVPGTPATSAFACWNGQVLAAIHLDVLETSRPGGPASVLRLADCPAMEAAAVRIAARFGLSGLHGLDFMRDASGAAHLIESNPRATQAAALALGAGRDLAAALAGCLSPAPRAARPAVTANPVIALFPQEWQRNPSSPWLQSAYLDVPWDDPAVLRACLAPGAASPERRTAARVGDFVFAPGKARASGGN
jgi:hypothetical protein